MPDNQKTKGKSVMNTFWKAAGYAIRATIHFSMALISGVTHLLYFEVIGFTAPILFFLFLINLILFLRIYDKAKFEYRENVEKKSGFAIVTGVIPRHLRTDDGRIYYRLVTWNVRPWHALEPAPGEMNYLGLADEVYPGLVDYLCRKNLLPFNYMAGYVDEYGDQ